MRNGSHVINATGNIGIASGGGTTILEFVSVYHDPLTLLLGFCVLAVGTLFKILHYRLEKNREPK